MWFFAPEATLFLLVALLLPVVVVRGFGAGGMVFPLLFVAWHFVGCLNSQKETELFLRDAGIEDGTDAPSWEVGAGGEDRLR
jgi:hypothetical protein